MPNDLSSIGPALESVNDEKSIEDWVELTYQSLTDCPEYWEERDAKRRQREINEDQRIDGRHE